METVQDAIFEGATELSIHCEECRFVRVVDIRQLPGLMGEQPLSSLHERLRCKRCGLRPKPEHVKLAKPPTFHSGRYPG